MGSKSRRLQRNKSSSGRVRYRRQLRAVRERGEKMPFEIAREKRKFLAEANDAANELRNSVLGPVRAYQ